MQNTELAAEQQTKLEQMLILAKLSNAANILADFLLSSGSTFEQALPLFQAITERELKNLQNETIH